LMFAHSSGQSGNVTKNQDSLSGDGQGKFDFSINFPTNTGDDFGRNETSIWILTAAGLTASDFLSLSNKGVLATTHVQRIDTPGGGNDNAKSGWVIAGEDDGTPPSNVPEPHVAILLGLGLVGLRAFRRQRQ